MTRGREQEQTQKDMRSKQGLKNREPGEREGTGQEEGSEMGQKRVQPSRMGRPCGQWEHRRAGGDRERGCTGAPEDGAADGGLQAADWPDQMRIRRGQSR